MKAGDLVRISIDFALEDWIFTEEDRGPDDEPYNREKLGLGIVLDVYVEHRPEYKDWESVKEYQELVNIYWLGVGKTTKFMPELLEMVEES
jgi:hypothetical protein